MTTKLGQSRAFRLLRNVLRGFFNQTSSSLFFYVVVHHGIVGNLPLCGVTVSKPLRLYFCIRGQVLHYYIITRTVMKPKIDLKAKNRMKGL